MWSYGYPSVSTWFFNVNKFQKVKQKGAFDDDF